MSMSYYLQQQSELDRDKLPPGSLIGVRSWTKPGPTFAWAINPYMLVGFSQNFVWIKDGGGKEMSFSSFVEIIQMCLIQKWHFEEIPE